MMIKKSVVDYCNMAQQRIENLSKKKIVTMFGTVILLLSVAMILLMCFGTDAVNQRVETSITSEEKEAYRNMIGDGLDVKKAILVMFDNEETCKDFIVKHGADKHPEDCGLGKVPLMEKGYFNIGGKQELENVFDGLSDGEYSGEPVIYAGMFCYLKRIELYSPLKSDKDMEELIRREKKLKNKGR